MAKGKVGSRWGTVLSGLLPVVGGGWPSGSETGNFPLGKTKAAGRLGWRDIDE